MNDERDARIERMGTEIDRLRKALGSAKIPEAHRRIMELELIVDRLHPRVLKLVRLCRPFIIIGEREPYYEFVYGLIRKQEKHQGTWTDDCEVAFQVAMQRVGEIWAAKLEAAERSEA